MMIWNTTTHLCNRTITNCTTETYEDNQSSGIFVKIIIPVVILLVVSLLVLVAIRLHIKRLKAKRRKTRRVELQRDELSRRIQNETDTLYISKYNTNCTGI